MDQVQIKEGFGEDDRGRVAELFWEAFGHKLRPGFANEETGRAVLSATIRSDRVLSAYQSGELLVMCGFHQAGVGSVDLSWSKVRKVVSFPAYLRALLVLSVISTSERAGAFVLDGIAVHVDARGKGIGTALLRRAADKAKASGASAVRLAVVDSNPKARSLYEREGFVQVESGSIGFLSLLYRFKTYVNMELKVQSD